MNRTYERSYGVSGYVETTTGSSKSLAGELFAAGLSYSSVELDKSDEVAVHLCDDWFEDFTQGWQRVCEQKRNLSEGFGANVCRLQVGTESFGADPLSMAK